MSNNLIKRTREAAVAGLFYSQQQDVLFNSVKQLLQEQSDCPQINHKTPSALNIPKALIVPHAGYIYSGSMAAKGFVQIASQQDHIKHVALLGPAHRVYLNAMAIPTATHFATPLGKIPINQEACHKLLSFEGVMENDEAHAEEHCIEVQLPFLQCILEDFSITPIVVGDIAVDKVSAVIADLIDTPHTLTIISSDLSHFLPYEAAKQRDNATSSAILNLVNRPLDGSEACGCHAINGLIQLARARNYSVSQLGICNSGDTAGDKNRVVGYGAWRFD